MKNYSSNLAIVNHRNWLDDSPPLIFLCRRAFFFGRKVHCTCEKLNWGFRLYLLPVAKSKAPNFFLRWIVGSRGEKVLIWQGMESNDTCLLVERQRLRHWSGRFEIQIWGHSNRTQCCQQLATAATFFERSCVARAQRRRNGLCKLFISFSVISREQWRIQKILVGGDDKNFKHKTSKIRMFCNQAHSQKFAMKRLI